MQTKSVSVFDSKILWPAIGDAFKKLNPRLMVKNPVMFVTLVGAAISTVDAFRSPGQTLFVAQIALWLWFTVLFANFAEAVAEGRGKAQAKALRATRTRTSANKISGDRIEVVDADSLRKGDSVVVRATEIIPADGEIVLGAATVDESAITGESAPVIREAGGDRSAVTGGTRVLS
ncbi:MAG: potassium-transporting ATPase subunit B, partial [Verrucomicrobiota bacterium]